MRIGFPDQKFSILFERSADAQLIMMGDVFIECNKATLTLLGADSKNQVIGLTPWDVSPEFQPDGGRSRDLGLKIISAVESGTSMRFEWLHTRIDGSEVPTEVSLTPVDVESESFIHVVLRDISDRRKAEKELHVANQLYKLIMANSPDMIWIRDLDFQLKYINKAIERMKGFTQEEALVRKLEDNVTPDSYRFFIKTLQEELGYDAKPGVDPYRVRRFESDEICADGSIIHTETMASFVRDEKGNPTGMLGITRDISEQQLIFEELEKAKLKAEESDRLKSAFLANMSHEIRTPMNSILGFAELLGEDDLESGERKQYVSIIQSGTNQLLTIISDIIDISKIEAGQLLLNIQPVNIHSLFDELYTNFGMELVRIGKTGIQLKRTCTCHLTDPRIMLDPGRLTQVMVNLLSNAIKFTDRGEVEFGCIHSGTFIRFFVRDTGKGISPAHQRIIFERFRQVDESLTRSYTGTGLGLAICKGLVTLMGGEIGVDSAPGKGSEFWFTVPDPRDLNQQ